MPIYQYKCSECDHQLEALQKMSDAKLVDCPECAAPSLRKQVTSARFKLKGTGWYETDFKNSGKKPQPATSDKSSATEASSADKGSSLETKSADSESKPAQSSKPDKKEGAAA